MLNIGQTVTYMKLAGRTPNQPKKIRVSTIYDPTRESRHWETMIFNQRQKKSGYGDGWSHHVISEYHTSSEPQEQHERIVEMYRRLGYKVTREHVNSVSKGLEEIGILDLAGSSKEQWNQWLLLKYLYENSRI